MRAVAITAALALTLPALARADGGGATINRLPDSARLEGHVEVEHQCAGGSLATCFWYGEATQYPASVECPEVSDASHSVWIGPLEESGGSSSSDFAFTPEATVVRICLYIETGEESSLVGQSHPFNTQTGSEVLRRPPGRQPTRAVLTVRVFHSCKAHVYADAIGGGEEERGGSWSGAALWAPHKAKLHEATRTQPWFWTVEGPPGSYRLRMHFDGNATMLPSPPATVTWRLRRCSFG